MARTLEQIQSAIKLEVRTYPSLDSFLFPEDGGSSVGVFNLLIYIVSLAMFTFETIVDVLKTDIETASQEAPVGNPQWVRKQMLLFQLGDTIILDDDFLPGYAVVDESLRIVTNCSVTEEFSSEIKIKVAKTVADVITPLSGAEVTALEDYYYAAADQEGIGFAGVRAEFISISPDRMVIGATVSYFGQFIEANVKVAVIAAIDLHFANIGFDGVVYLNRLVADVEAVDGVNNFQITAVIARKWDVLVNNGENIEVNGQYETIAGYLISEDTLGSTLVNTITMVQV